MTSTQTQENTTPTRAEVEDFLYYEASLLDEWRLEDWLKLLTDDAEYVVPAMGMPDADERKTLSIVNDDRARIDARVKQYLDELVYPESPRSRVRRMLSNVRILDATSEQLRVTANFVCYRFASEIMDVFVGRYEPVLVKHGNSFRIRKRRVMLDLDALRPHGKLSIIL